MIYEYKCDSCDTTWEKDSPDIEFIDHSAGEFKCKGKVKRVYSFGGFVLKGPGFYRNDK